MSSILVATPAPTELPTIYRAGDLLLKNPQQTCVIFVTVILISAFLEYFLQRVTNVENRYVRVLVTTMSQEITIVGVLALFLMFAVSVVPRDLMKPLFVQLFNWANISLFFLAIMFVFVIVLQFAWSALEVRYVWKVFEEGTLETEELAKLSYPKRMFKMAHELYRQELLSKSGLPTSSVPFHEYTALIWRRSLVRVSNLTFRTWFFLSFVILLNLIRIMFIPWANGLSGNDLAFFNQLTLMGILGWGMFLSYVFFLLLMQSRLKSLASGDTTLAKDEHGYQLIPCGTLKRAVEYIQVLIFSYNWYVVLFITGGYRQVSELTVAWQSAVLMLMFFAPMFIVMATLPWCFHCMAMLHIIGNVSPKVVLGIFRRIRGEGEDEDEDDDDDDDDEEAEMILAAIARQMKGGAASDRGSVSKSSKAPGSKKPTASSAAAAAAGGDSSSSGLSGLKAGTLPGATVGKEPGEEKQEKPSWAEDDDDWDGNTTLAFGERRTNTEKQKAGALFVGNVDSDRLRNQLKKMNVIEEEPEVKKPEEKKEPSAAKQKLMAAASLMAAGARGTQKREAEEDRKKREEEEKKKASRPAWLDSDEDFDDEIGIKKL